MSTQDKPLRVTFNIEFKGIWIDVDVKQGISALDGKHWVSSNEVRHADEDITPLIAASVLSEIDRQIEKELNKNDK